MKSRCNNINIKKFSILSHDVYLIPHEIFESFVEISNDLTMNSDADLKLSEAATGGVLWEKVFLEISQNSQESTCTRALGL